MQGPLRFGVISTAQIGLNRLIPAAREASNAEVVAISSRGLEKAKAAAAKLGIATAYGSYDEVLKDPNVQAVINPLPNSMHAEWTIKACDAGKHVLCEKPLATTVAEAKSMADAAKRNGVLLMEAFTHRFNPQLRFARQAVREGRVGDVRFVRSEFGFTMRNPVGNIRFIPELGGGGLFDAGCYSASAIRFVMGEDPDAVSAYQRAPKEYGVDVSLAGVMHFPGDRLGLIACGMDMPPRCFLEVTGTKGRVEVLHMFEENSSVRTTIDGKEEMHPFSAPNRFRVQIEHFSDCVLNNKPLEFPPADAIGNVALIEALKTSANTGQPARLAS